MAHTFYFRRVGKRGKHTVQAFPFPVCITLGSIRNLVSSLTKVLHPKFCGSFLTCFTARSILPVIKLMRGAGIDYKEFKPVRGQVKILLGHILQRRQPGPAVKEQGLARLAAH